MFAATCRLGHRSIVQVSLYCTSATLPRNSACQGRPSPLGDYCILSWPEAYPGFPHCNIHVMQKRIHQNPAMHQKHHFHSHPAIPAIPVCTSLGSAGCGSRERCESTGGCILWCCRCQWFQSRWVIACWKLLPNQSCKQGVPGSQVWFRQF